MPELPEVETIARELRPLVLDATITGAWWDWPAVVRHPAPAEFENAIAGKSVLDVTRRAKWLLLELSGDAVLAIQVKMTGQLFVMPADEPRDRHVHFLLRLAGGREPDRPGGRELRLRDVRKFGRVGVYRRDEAGLIRGADEVRELFAEHGPEPLSDELTLPAFRRLLRARRGRLKPLLLDQSFLAGIGNIYADEALWRAQLHPLRRVSSLRPRDERALYQAIRSSLAEAVERRGSSVDDYTAPEGDGEMQEYLRSYGRTGLPCPRCGRPIRRIVLGARGTHFCSWCQRLPAADRTDAALLLSRGAVTRARRGRNYRDLAGAREAVGGRPTKTASRAARPLPA
jgi:formamidopyrimidine-DNA glycosylase